MAKVTSIQARPIQGVSQQPEKNRLDGQCSVQDNMIPDVVDGLKKRIGTKAIAKIMDSISENSKIHYYSQGGGEEYFIIVEPGELPRIFTENGIEQNLTLGSFPSLIDGLPPYLQGATNPREDLVMKTIGDFTFVVNNKKPVALKSASSEPLGSEAIVNVSFANYGKDYKVFIDGIERASVTTPDGDNPQHIQDIDTVEVANGLVGGTSTTTTAASLPVGADIFSFKSWFEIAANAELVSAEQNGTGLPSPLSVEIIGSVKRFTYSIANLGTSDPVDVVYRISTGTGTGLGSVAGFTVTQTGNSIHIRKNDGTAFSLRTEDGSGGADIVAVKGRVPTVSRLPKYAPAGFKIKIQQDGERDSDGYWLLASTADGDSTRWVETIAPGVTLGADTATMPHVLVRESVVGGVANFVLRLGEWQEREAGDDLSNPHPSFINTSNPQPISGVGLFQNRLYVTSRESVIMTKTANFFDFYRSSTQVTADDDPVDLFSDSTRVSVLKQAIALDGDLSFFSDNAQFIMDGSKPITKENATLSLVTEYQNQSNISPVAAGENIFFGFNYGRFSGIREFFTDSITDTKRSSPTTDNVVNYLDGAIRQMTASTSNNWLVVLTENSDNIVYIYNWLWLGDEKVQSAWHRWVFPEGSRVEHVEFSDDKFYLIISREGGGVLLEVVELGDQADDVLPYPARLDRRMELVTEYSNGIHQIDDPYPGVDPDDIVLIRGSGCFPEDIGTSIAFSRVANKLVIDEAISDLESGVTVIVGTRFNMLYQPTQPLVKDHNGRVIGTDKLTLSRIFINYERTGNIGVRISSEAGSVREYEHNGRFIGAPNNLVGFAPLQDGQFQVPVMQKSDQTKIEIESSSHLPFQLRDIEWTGQFNQRGRRI